LVGYGTTSTRAKWRSLWSARVSTLKEALDTADTVRDGDITPIIAEPRSDADEHNDGEKHVQNVIVTRVNAVVLPLTNGCALHSSWGQ
jgi:hypothetical protein